jgi:vanillate O-demethylase monooxygenase subunit
VRRVAAALGFCGTIRTSLSLRNSLEEAFMEDRVIEAQQKVFDADPNYQLLAIGADAALTYFRWALARRIEAERNAARAA